MPIKTDILRQIKSNDPTLTSLDLSYEELNDQDATRLANALKTNNTLQSMELRSNNIGAQGAAALLEALETNTSLRSIDLSGNKISLSVAAKIMDCLLANATDQKQHKIKPRQSSQKRNVQPVSKGNNSNSNPVNEDLDQPDAKREMPAHQEKPNNNSNSSSIAYSQFFPPPNPKASIAKPSPNKPKIPATTAQAKAAKRLSVLIVYQLQLTDQQSKDRLKTKLQSLLLPHGSMPYVTRETKRALAEKLATEIKESVHELLTSNEMDDLVIDFLGDWLEEQQAQQANASQHASKT